MDGCALLFLFPLLLSLGIIKQHPSSLCLEQHIWLWRRNGFQINTQSSKCERRRIADRVRVGPPAKLPRRQKKILSRSKRGVCRGGRERLDKCLLSQAASMVGLIKRTRIFLAQIISPTVLLLSIRLFLKLFYFVFVNTLLLKQAFRFRVF